MISIAACDIDGGGRGPDRRATDPRRGSQIPDEVHRALKAQAAAHGRSAEAELREIEFREIELRSRRQALGDEIARLDIRAPVSGVVYGSTADTLRGVVRAAEPILSIVPQDVGLIARAQIEAAKIDQVHVGQTATMRFSAFDSRTTPVVAGKVTRVSADIFTDQRTGHSYYRADIALDETVLAELQGRRLVPGMPVEAFIATEDRSVLTYFVKPMEDYFTRAFRER